MLFGAVLGGFRRAFSAPKNEQVKRLALFRTTPLASSRSTGSFGRLSLTLIPVFEKAADAKTQKIPTNPHGYAVFRGVDRQGGN